MFCDTSCSCPECAFRDLAEALGDEFRRQLLGPTEEGAVAMIRAGAAAPMDDFQFVAWVERAAVIKASWN